MDMMPGTPYAAPMPGDPPIAPGTPPGGDNEIDFRKPILKYVYELEKRLGLPPGTLSNPAGTWPGPGYDGDD